MESNITPVGAVLGDLPRSTEAHTQKSFIITTGSSKNRRARSSNQTLLSRRMQLRI